MDLRQCLCLLISRWCLFLSFLPKLKWFLAVKSDRARRNVSFFLVLYFVDMKLFFAWFSFLENLIICPVLSIRFHRNPHTIFIEEYKASLETDKLLFSLKRYLWEWESFYIKKCFFCVLGEERHYISIEQMLCSISKL